MNVLISSCFLLPTRYDGRSQAKPEMRVIIDFLKEEGINIIPVCPEQLGGLCTPRLPAEIIADRVIDVEGNDVSTEFITGANSVLKLCQELNVKVAIMKERSPSCGVHHIYDGTHTSTIINGKGITTKLLNDNGIVVFSEKEIERIKDFIWKQKI